MIYTTNLKTIFLKNNNVHMKCIRKNYSESSSDVGNVTSPSFCTLTS